MGKKRVHMAHLGCAKNMVDSEIHLANFHKLGFESVEEPEEADLVIINTCGFIQSAKEQSIDTIFSMTGMKKAKVVVTGCLYQRYQDLSSQMPEVNGWLKSNTMEEVSQLILDLGFDIPKGEYFSNGYDRVLMENSSHAYLRIAEGCNKNCSFCSIPGFKGRMASRTIESLVSEANDLIHKGVRELNLVSQDTANYGSDIYGVAKGGGPLKTLLKELVALPIHRIRLLYLYPLWLNHDFFEFMASEPKICNYIDMPLQHASSKVLKAMKRPGSKAEYINEMQTIRSIFNGDVALRSTFIVGFPGEKDEDFQELKSFVQEVRFDWLGAFTYSQEESTSSHKLKNDVHHRTKQKRHKELISAYEQTRQTIPSPVGSIRNVLLEEEINGVWMGRSQYEAPEVDGVIYVNTSHGSVGKAMDVRIDAELEFDLEASEIGRA